MASKTAAGLAARVIGRPTTSFDAPSAIATAAVATRLWSSSALPGSRIPGTTSKGPLPNSARRPASSPDEHTSPRNSRGKRQSSQPQHLLFDRRTHTDAGQLTAIHAGQHCHRNQRRCIRQTSRSLRGRRKHGPSTRRMDREQGSPAACNRAYRAGDRIGNIVQLQVEKDLKPASPQLLNDRFAFRQEKLKSDFEPATLPLEPFDQPKSRFSGWEIQGYNQPFQWIRRQRNSMHKGSSRGVLPGPAYTAPTGSEGSFSCDCTMPIKLLGSGRIGAEATSSLTRPMPVNPTARAAA